MGSRFLLRLSESLRIPFEINEYSRTLVDHSISTTTIVVCCSQPYSAVHATPLFTFPLCTSSHGPLQSLNQKITSFSLFLSLSLSLSSLPPNLFVTSSVCHVRGSQFAMIYLKQIIFIVRIVVIHVRLQYGGSKWVMVVIQVLHHH